MHPPLTQLADASDSTKHPSFQRKEGPTRLTRSTTRTGAHRELAGSCLAAPTHAQPWGHLQPLCRCLGSSWQQHRMRHPQRTEGKSQHPGDFIQSHLPKGGPWPWEGLPAEAPGGVTIWESTVQKETSWAKASRSSSLLSLAAGSARCGQTPALTVTHHTCPAQWLRA